MGYSRGVRGVKPRRDDVSTALVISCSVEVISCHVGGKGSGNLPLRDVSNGLLDFVGITGSGRRRLGVDG